MRILLRIMNKQIKDKEAVAVNRHYCADFPVLNPYVSVVLKCCL